MFPPFRFRSGRLLAVAAAMAVVGAGCSFAHRDVAAWVHGEAVPADAVRELAAIRTSDGQPLPIASITSPSAAPAGTARELLASIVAVRLLSREFRAMGMSPTVDAETVRSKIEATEFDPPISEAAVDLLVEVETTATWLQQLGPMPGDAAATLIERHPELLQQLCLDYISAEPKQRRAVETAIAEDGFDKAPGYTESSCLPLSSVAAQPENVRDVLETGEIDHAVGPMKIAEAGDTLFWFRPKGASTMDQEQAMAAVTPLLSSPLALAGALASIPGAVEISPEFGTSLTFTTDSVAVEPPSGG